MSKCPKCEKVIARFTLVAVKAQQGMTTWNCVSYNCPYCSTAISVQIDPTLIRDEIVDAVMDRLRKQK